VGDLFTATLVFLYLTGRYTTGRTDVLVGKRFKQLKALIKLCKISYLQLSHHLRSRVEGSHLC
jgi:hypothetical protein